LFGILLYLIPEPAASWRIMSPEEQYPPDRDPWCAQPAREAYERLRSALAEATVWLTNAMTDDDGGDDTAIDW